MGRFILSFIRGFMIKLPLFDKNTLIKSDSQDFNCLSINVAIYFISSSYILCARLGLVVKENFFLEWH